MQDKVISRPCYEKEKAIRKRGRGMLLLGAIGQQDTMTSLAHHLSKTKAGVEKTKLSSLGHPQLFLGSQSLAGRRTCRP